jgi:hypothetical protein
MIFGKANEQLALDSLPVTWATKPRNIIAETTASAHGPSNGKRGDWNRVAL